MKISTSRDVLLGSLQQIAGVVERRQTLPILSNTLVTVRGNNVFFTATDLEVELKTSAVMDCETEGEFTVPARKLLDICRALPSEAG